MAEFEIPAEVVEAAATAIDSPAFDESDPLYAGPVRQFRRASARATARAALEAAAPAIRAQALRDAADRWVGESSIQSELGDPVAEFLHQLAYYAERGQS